MDSHIRKKTITDRSSDSNKIDLRNEIQADFGNHPVPWFNWVFDALDHTTSRRLLEWGSGSGAFWKENSTRIPSGWEIFLSDRSVDLIRDARNQLQAVPGAMRFLGMDSQALPFPSDQFDTLVAVGVLDLIPDLDRALREGWRVLRPSGQFLATAGGKGHMHELEDLLRPYLPPGRASQLGGTEDRFGMENGARRLAHFFEKVDRQDYYDQMVFTSPQPVLDYVLSEQQITGEMSLSGLAGFVRRLNNELDRRGEIRVTIHKGLFVARK